MFDAFAIGNLTHDPVLRETNNGNKMCTFTVACRTNQRSDSGGMETAFIQAAVFGRQADTAAMYLKKGNKVAVAGGMSTRDYTAKDGTNRTALQITVDRMEFLTPRSENEGGAQQGQSQQRSRPAQRPANQPAANNDNYDDYDTDLPF